MLLTFCSLARAITFTYMQLFVKASVQTTIHRQEYAVLVLVVLNYLLVVIVQLANRTSMEYAVSETHRFSM